LGVGGTGNLGTASYYGDLPLYTGDPQGYGTDLNFPLWGWLARSKDQNESDPASITCYAISIMSRILLDDYPGPPVYHGYTVGGSNATESPQGRSQPHPSATQYIRPGKGNELLMGGGAQVCWEDFGGPEGAGNLLWHLEPIFDKNKMPNGKEAKFGFVAESKDHLISDPCGIISYAIGLSLEPF
jgi:hypothetical protein